MGTRLDFNFYAKEAVSVRTTSKILRIPKVYGVISLTGGNVVRGGGQNDGPLRSLIITTVQVYVRNDGDAFRVSRHAEDQLKRYLSRHDTPLIEVVHTAI